MSVVVAPVVACTVGDRLLPRRLCGGAAGRPEPAGRRSFRLSAAGAVIGLLTTLFSVVAPHLVSSYLTLGIVGSVFIALVWFNLVFQILLYGAAFARLRRDERRRAALPTL